MDERSAAQKIVGRGWKVVRRKPSTSDFSTRLIDKIPRPTPLKATFSKLTPSLREQSDASRLRNRINVRLAMLSVEDLMIIDMFTAVVQRRRI